LHRGQDDERRAVDAATVAMVACRSSMSRKVYDPWAGPTLLGATFDRGDVEKARDLVEEIRQEGTVAWKLETTIKDLSESLVLHEQPDVQAGLAEVLATVREMVRR
jgi:hypothetical protein